MVFMMVVMVVIVLPPFTAAKPCKISAHCSCASLATWDVMESTTALRETLQMRPDVSHDDHDDDQDGGGDGHDGGDDDHDGGDDDDDHFFHDAPDETGF